MVKLGAVWRSIEKQKGTMDNFYKSYNQHEDSTMATKEGAFNQQKPTNLQ
jgi:hypothetical protein